jgi:phosphatidylserine/phosphatidylglycerophosphate/cardiolipin synthase-like enzyme
LQKARKSPTNRTTALILPSQSDSWLVLRAGRLSYAQRLRAGVRIYERRGVILQAQTALVDGVWATIGSTNLGLAQAPAQQRARRRGAGQ